MIKAGLLFLVHVYRLVGSPIFGGSCRFYPSCSTYAVQALNCYNPLKATGLILRRLGRCRPGGGAGYDPVPGCQCEGRL